MIALVAATATGRARAEHLAAALPEARLVPGRPSEALADAFVSADGVVLFLAVGAAVRLIAPLLGDKRTDPGVVCVDDGGRFAVALAGGHGGGANALAERVAAALGAQPVITTASDATGRPALDELARDLGLRIAPGSQLSAVGAALVGGEPVDLVLDRRRPLGPMPPNVSLRDRPGEAPALVVDDRIGVTDASSGPQVVLRPPSLVAGVGASRGASAAEILELLEASLAAAGLAPESLSALATIDVKREEPGLVAAAAELALPLKLFDAQELAAVEVPSPSPVVQEAVGTPSVAEAAAVRAAAEPSTPERLPAAPELVVAKRKSTMATVAIARRGVRGRLALVSLGPGADGLLAPRARFALDRAELVVGLVRYVDSIRHLLRPGVRIEGYRLGEEVERCRRAVAEARAGGSVALVSSGDVGVYAMASPALEEGGLESVDVEVIPGITAASAAAALVGSPLGHDFCAISLSDLLTPWERIAERLRSAAEADFAVALYNPRSRARDWQLEAARELLLEGRPPSTPVAVVSDAYRPEQHVELTTLGALDPEHVSMTTTVIVGSSRTRMVEGRMVTPRGYEARVEPPPAPGAGDAIGLPEAALR
jgi:cobalt-precorrin 5A hydrolase/precorrin-3B C17-methyltransferase